jgi:hypothetical protein
MIGFKRGNNLPFLAVSLACLLLLAIVSTLTTVDTIHVKNVEAQAPEDFRFAAVGDWGCTANTNSMTSLMASKSPEVVLGLGDYSYTTEMTCWHDIIASYPTIHDAIHAYNSVAFGNHETTCGNSSCLSVEGRQEYLDHFSQPPTYFSFDHKRAHFIALDSNIAFDTSSNQYAFISADLSQAKGKKDDGLVDWIVAFMHHPLYTSCINNPCDTSHGNKTGIRSVYQPLFDSNDVDLVLQGHVHAYERMKPMIHDGIIMHPDVFDYANPQGQIYITVGTGGRSLYEYTTKPEMSVIQIEDYGFLQLDVTRTSLIGRFIDNSDTVRDSFVIVKTNDVLPSPVPPPPEPLQGPNLPAYYFTGSNYTQVSSSSSLKLSQFSVATWFKFDTDYSKVSTKRLIVNKGGFGSESSGQNMNYGIWVDSGSSNGNKIQAGFETSSGPDLFVRSPARYNDGQWHYAVVTYNGSTLRLYIDGQQVNMLSTTAKPDNTGNQPLRLGMNSLTLDRGYTGYADEVRIWNRAVTAQEVADQFDLGIFDTNGQVSYLSP